MSRYLLRQVAKDKTVKLFTVDQYAAIPTERGATYRLLDAATEQPVGEEVLRKSGDALVIEVGGSNVAQLDQFYGAQREAAYEAGHSGGWSQQITEGLDVSP